MMKKFCIFLLLCTCAIVVQAQKITRDYQDMSLSKVLEDLNSATDDKPIYFIYDELEDFTVTCSIKHLSIEKALKKVIGFYPIHIVKDGNNLFVECFQKERTKLRGRLIGPDHQPVAYANIVLYTPSDSTYIGGGVSNEAGDFVIPCGAQQTWVRISCVGFKTIERTMPVGDTGTIRMQMENNYLGNVTVNGQRPLIRNEVDRLQYIVSNDAFAHGLNAQELLSRVPMVSMSGGRATILGKGPAHFMLNGRITEIGDEAIYQKLWTMRAEDIERIEVVSTPSGRDIIESGGGYINIVTRRDQALGWRGDVSTQASMSDNWSGRIGGSTTFASEKFDISIDATGGRKTQTTDNSTVYRTDDGVCVSDTRTKQTDKEVAANLMLRYLPIKSLELGAMLSWQTRWPEKTINGIITYTGESSISEAEQSPDDIIQTKSLTAYCDWRLDTKGKMLSLTYNNYKKDDDTRINVCYTAPSYYHNVVWNKMNSSNVDYHIQSGRLDLSLPYHIATIDAGASYTSIKNQIPVQNYYDGVSMNYDYQEKDKAAYLSLHREWGKYAVKAALRYEHISLSDYPLYRDIYSEYEVFGRDYWLPSFSFSVKPKDGHQISLTYGTNTIRPNFYDLNPLRIYKTGYESFNGNPELRPSRTSNIELSYHNHKGFYACAYHHHASNVVAESTTFQDYRSVTSDTTYHVQFHGVTSLPENKGRTNQTGLYLRYQHQVIPSLLLTAEGEACYHEFKTTNSVYIREYAVMDLYGWKERLTISTDWYLNRQHTLLLNARYQHWFSDYTGLTKTDSYGYFYFALRYSMMDDRLKLSLVANDPFHQYVTDETLYNGWVTRGNNRRSRMLQFSHTNHHAHYIGITATYALGSKKVRRIEHDMTNTESKRAERE